jgi:hypothetical protein
VFVPKILKGRRLFGLGKTIPGVVGEVKDQKGEQHGHQRHPD